MHTPTYNITRNRTEQNRTEHTMEEYGVVVEGEGEGEGEGEKRGIIAN